MLLLHIGLPKTATTFLQRFIFKPAVGHRRLHRLNPGDGEDVCRAIRAYVRANDRDAATLPPGIVSLLRPYAGAETTIVTDENISVGASDFWNGGAATPDQAATRLATERAALTDMFGEVRVLIGVRRQDGWLASRYAQSSKFRPDFSQDDFDRRALQIAAGPLRGPAEWLDYDAMRSKFVAAFGAANLFIYSMEKLREDPDAVLEPMGRFSGNLDFVALRHDALAAGSSLKVNPLSKGEDAWRMPGRSSELLVLKPRVKAALLDRFASTNAALGELVDLQFD